MKESGVVRATAVNFKGGDPMSENECAPGLEGRDYFKEAVCIDAMRIYDSCSE